LQLLLVSSTLSTPSSCGDFELSVQLVATAPQTPHHLPLQVRATCNVCFLPQTQLLLLHSRDYYFTNKRSLLARVRASDFLEAARVDTGAMTRVQKSGLTWPVGRCQRAPERIEAYMSSYSSDRINQIPPILFDTCCSAWCRLCCHQLALVWKQSGHPARGGSHGPPVCHEA
jgi:hypothetical protein